MVRGCMYVWTYNCRWYVNPKNNVVLVGVNNTFSCKSRKSLPILLPGGAVTPAINDTTGLAFSPWLLSWRNSAALSSAPPPISPIRTIPEKYHVTQSNRWQWHKLFCANTLMSLKRGVYSIRSSIGFYVMFILKAVANAKKMIDIFKLLSFLLIK